MVEPFKPVKPKPETLNLQTHEELDEDGNFPFDLTSGRRGRDRHLNKDLGF